MGKNTLAEIGKIILSSILTILITVLFLQNKISRGKVDQVVFDRYVDRHSHEHDLMELRRKEERDSYKEFMNARFDGMDTRFDDLKELIKKGQ